MSDFRIEDRRSIRTVGRVKADVAQWPPDSQGAPAKATPTPQPPPERRAPGIQATYEEWRSQVFLPDGSINNTAVYLVPPVFAYALLAEGIVGLLLQDPEIAEPLIRDLIRGGREDLAALLTELYRRGRHTPQ